MKTIALIAVAAATVAAPAFAQSAEQTAIEIFNRSADNASQLIVLPTQSPDVTVSSSTLSVTEVEAIFNRSADTRADLVMFNDAAAPANAADIWARLDAQVAEDE